jgi:hypothetical protein
MTTYSALIDELAVKRVANAKSIPLASLLFVFLRGMHAKVFQPCLRQRYRPVKPRRAEFRSFLRSGATGWRLIGFSSGRDRG